jgi:hypothetical protein
VAFLKQRTYIKDKHGSLINFLLSDGAKKWFDVTAGINGCVSSDLVQDMIFSWPSSLVWHFNFCGILTTTAFLCFGGYAGATTSTSSSMEMHHAESNSSSSVCPDLFDRV